MSIPVDGVSETFRALTGFEPYDYQRRAWEEILGIMERGGVVTLEVPTAGGKTEAATMPFLHQVLTGEWLVSRLIYVLPTRSLVRRQADRLEVYLRGASGRGRREGASVRVEMGMEPTFLFLGDVVVSTWDAFLYGLAAHRTLGTRFTFPTGAIAESMVIFDEVQMYQDEEMYMPALMGLVVERLREARIPTVVMTATMPSKLKEVLGISSYPTVKVSESDERKPERGDVSTELVEADLRGEDLVERVSRAVGEGGKALIVRNTVSRAVETYGQLRDQFDGVVLLHSRFTVGDREERERALDDAKVIVATQVVEAGLDMPSVLELITDLAPLDALIQRIGRCARRPGEVGRATIVLPDFDDGIAGGELDALGVGENVEFASPRVDVGKLGVHGVEIVVDGEVRYLIDVSSYGRLGRKKGRRRDVLVLPFASAPYDPLILLRTLTEVRSRGVDPLLGDVDSVRDALDYVYGLHYSNNVVPQHFYDAYIYFRYLRLFSAPPEVKLRSRPQLYSILQVVEDDRLKEGELVDLDPQRMVRVDYRWLQSKARNLGILAVKSEYIREERKVVHRLERLPGRPVPYAVHAVGSSHYDGELGLLAEGGG